MLMDIELFVLAIVNSATRNTGVHAFECWYFSKREELRRKHGSCMDSIWFLKDSPYYFPEKEFNYISGSKAFEIETGRDHSLHLVKTTGWLPLSPHQSHQKEGQKVIQFCPVSQIGVQGWPQHPQAIMGGRCQHCAWGLP